MFKALELNEGENRKVEIDFQSNEKCLSNCVLIFLLISNNILGAKKCSTKMFEFKPFIKYLNN